MTPRIATAALVTAMSLLAAAPVLADGDAAAPVIDGYYCEEPKRVTAAGHTVSTPRVCVPAP